MRAPGLAGFISSTVDAGENKVTGPVVYPDAFLWMNPLDRNQQVWTPLPEWCRPPVLADTSGACFEKSSSQENS